ncbi:MAG: hypothetical protein FWD60_07080 [Candidatus Azobacteroides sp.]|nr:hypothetical protein [Candidatus Azobacteroides sp.]
MTIPSFDNRGKLPKGIHICSGYEFINRFCASDSRKQFEKPICDILDFAKNRYAIHIFVGGSFITDNNKPNDIDCVMVFLKDKYIPPYTERVSIAGLRFDILYASLESRDIIDSYLRLFSSGRNGEEDLGIIQIDLYEKNETWKIKHYPDEEALEIIKRVYNDRHLIDINEKNGVLVSIHGLLSKAEWNMEIAPIASNQGWVVAPYVYDTNTPDLLFNSRKRNKVVEEFREWIYDIQKRFDNKISIIAHSFGSYIIGAYLTGFDNEECPPVCFNSIILTGSILNPEFDWEKYRGLSVGKVYNTIAPNDEYVKFLPNADWKKLIGMSKLFGRSGVEGFNNESPMLEQRSNEIFTHTNTIKRDILETKWLPFLNANKNALDFEMIDYFKRNKL